MSSNGHPTTQPPTGAPHSSKTTNSTPSLVQPPQGAPPASKPAPGLPPPSSTSATTKFQARKLKPCARAPTRGSECAAGWDLCSAYDTIVPRNGRAVVSTELAVSIPVGRYGRIAPRSGLAVKKGIATGAGVIDADYRGQVMVLLFNHGEEDFKIEAGDRIAQLILERIDTQELEFVDELGHTVRGEGGFGSTGTS